MNELSYKEKYEKYKQKYLNLKFTIENSKNNTETNLYSENLLTGGKKKIQVKNIIVIQKINF